MIQSVSNAGNQNAKDERGSENLKEVYLGKRSKRTHDYHYSIDVDLSRSNMF